MASEKAGETVKFVAADQDGNLAEDLYTGSRLNFSIEFVTTS